MEKTLATLFENVPELGFDEMDEEDKEFFIEMEQYENVGLIALRVPKTLHLSLIEQAREERVSLSQYCLYKLAI